MTPKRSAAALAAVAIIVCSACGSSDDDSASPGSVPIDDALCLDVDRQDRPVVDLIDPALGVADELYGGDQRYFEISVDRQRVSLIVATGEGTAEQVFYCGAAGRTVPESLGDAQGATFLGDAVDIEPDSIFDQIDDELDTPEIVDFAVVGAGDDAVVYDATVQSGSGGVLLVLLAADGEVLAVQAQ